MPTTLIGSSHDLIDNDIKNRESTSYGLTASNPYNYGGIMPKLNDIHLHKKAQNN